MKRFAKLIGMFPFCGKLTIRPFVFGIYQSTTGGGRWKNYAALMVVLLLFILLHGLQAKMGVEALNFSAPIWVRGVAGLYALINACVVLTQIHLVFRATYFSLAKPLAKEKRVYYCHSEAEKLKMIVITLGGQIVFLLIYILYK